MRLHPTSCASHYVGDPEILLSLPVLASADWCISFGGLKPDRAVAAEILKAVEGNAIEAALEVAARIAEQQRERHRSLSLELEQARYEARLAARRYESVDPDNRLVAAELEARWNSPLSKA